MLGALWGSRLPRDGEDSSIRHEPPKLPPAAGRGALARTCRRAALADDPEDAIREVLSAAAAACGADRAFLVRSVSTDPDQSAIDAVHCGRDDGRTEPSRSVLRAVAERRASLVCPDVAADPSFNAGASVRGLALRTIAAAPVVWAGPGRAALVLDGRERHPVGADSLRELLESHADLLALLLAVRRGRDFPAPPAGVPALDSAGCSQTFAAMLAWARKVAATELPVLIEGESGSGKERVACEIHRSSRRAMGPYVAVNCTALNETLLEAELFGAVRGAYTGAYRDRPGLFRRAAGGSLLLDEIGDMSPAMQSKLLRAMQERRVRPVGSDEEHEVDVRIVAATHRDLRADVDTGRFRADLYYRVAVAIVSVPPLRERLEDLGTLVRELCSRVAAETGQRSIPISREAWGRLERYDWPGNVRELHAVLARAALRADGKPIRPEHLDLDLGAAWPAPPPRALHGPDAMERAMIDLALRCEGGSMTKAARQIGWSRQKLYRRMRALAMR